MIAKHKKCVPAAFTFYGWALQLQRGERGERGEREERERERREMSPSARSGALKILFAITILTLLITATVNFQSKKRKRASTSATRRAARSLERISRKDEDKNNKGSSNFVFKEVELSQCGGCKRKVRVTGSSISNNNSYTTCSQEAFARGQGQKVFSFSLFKKEGKKDLDKRFLDGLKLNLDRIAELYPGWVVRVYHNLTREEVTKHLCPLACNHNHSDILDLCQTSSNPLLMSSSMIIPTVWRFLPLADDQVEAANFRDLDSVVDEREMAAVGVWMESRYPFHMMRDHPKHDMPVMAGMWGIKKKGNKKNRYDGSKSLISTLKFVRAILDLQ